MLLLAASSTVFAEDVELFFQVPAENSVYHNSDSVLFVIEDMSMDYTDTLRAELYNADDESVVKNIGEWTGSDIEGRHEFSWTVDVGDGNYFVRVTEIDGEDHLVENTTRSYNFKVEGAAVEEAAAAVQEAGVVEEAAAVIAAPVRRRKRSIYVA